VAGRDRTGEARKFQVNDSAVGRTQHRDLGIPVGENKWSTVPTGPTLTRQRNQGPGEGRVPGRNGPRCGSLCVHGDDNLTITLKDRGGRFGSG